MSAHAFTDADIEHAAAAMATANDDGCFDPQYFTPAEWAAGENEEDREWWRKTARAGLAAIQEAAVPEAVKP